MAMIDDTHTKDYPGQPGRQNLLRWLKLIGLALAVGATMGIYAAIIINHAGGDLTSLYMAELRRDAGQPTYWPAPEADPRKTDCPEGNKAPSLKTLTSLSRAELLKLPICYHPNLNPPFFIVLAAPLAKLGFHAAWWSWFLLSLGCFSWAVFRILREGLFAVHSWTGVILAMVALIYFPTIISFLSGQVTAVVMVPIVLGWIRLRRGEDALGGMWLGLAASLKPFVGLFWVGLLVQKRWRAAMGMALSGLVCGLIGLLADGLDAYRGYVEALGTVSWQASSWNASFSGLFSRVFGGSQNTPWVDAPGLARGLTAAAGLSVLAFYLRGLWTTRDWPPRARADMLCAATLPAMLLISPLGWLYYFPLLLLCGMVLWGYSSRLPDMRRFRWALAGSMVLSGMPSWMISAREMNSPLDWFGPAGFYPIALVQLFALALAQVWRVRIA